MTSNLAVWTLRCAGWMVFMDFMDNPMKIPWDLGVPHTLGNLNWCKLILRGKGSNVAISDYHTSRFQLVWKSSNPWGYNPYKCPIIAGTALPSTTLKLTFFFQLWVNIFVSDHNLFIFGDSVTVALKSYHLRRYPQQWGHNNVAIPEREIGSSVVSIKRLQSGRCSSPINLRCPIV